MKKFNSGDSSTSTRNSENRDPVRKFCDCGLRARVCTSSKGKNIGKSLWVVQTMVLVVQLNL